MSNEINDIKAGRWVAAKAWSPACTPKQYGLVYRVCIETGMIYFHVGEGYYRSVTLPGRERRKEHYSELKVVCKPLKVKDRRGYV